MTDHTDSDFWCSTAYGGRDWEQRSWVSTGLARKRWKHASLSDQTTDLADHTTTCLVAAWIAHGWRIPGVSVKSSPWDERQCTPRIRTLVLKRKNTCRWHSRTRIPQSLSITDGLDYFWNVDCVETLWCMPPVLVFMNMWTYKSWKQRCLFSSSCFFRSPS